MSGRVAIVGVGLHGRRIANVVLDQGGELVGAADPVLAGRTLADVLGHPAAPDTPIVADAAELPGGDAVEVAIVTAPVDLDGLAAIALPILARGIDVLTIHPDAFDPPPAWAERVDAHARAHGTSMLATGVQDVWWVHVPAVAAGAVTGLRSVRFEHAVDLDTLSRPLGELFGVGREPETFDAIRDEVLLAESSVLGGPMRVLARRLGLTPGAPERSLEPLLAAVPTRWETGETDVAAGTLTGFAETVRVTTAEGVELHGVIRTALLAAGEEPTDRVILEGDPTLHLEHRPFPGDRITDVVPVARIADIRNAPPGLHTAGTLPPASYRHVPPANTNPDR